jgi:hypothetical protein
LRWHDPADASVFEDYPELEDVADDLAAYLPLAAAVTADDVRCVMLAREAPHRVTVFDDGFHVLAPSLEQLFDAAVLAPNSTDTRADRKDEAAAAIAALSQHEQAGRWQDARVAAEALLATWKDPEQLTELRVRYAVILAQLGDGAAADALATDHVRHLAWLAGSDRPGALAMQAAMLVRLDDAMHDDVARVLARVRETIAAPIVEPPTAPPISDDDRSTALRLIRGTKTLQLASLFKQSPALLEDPQIRAAVDALPASPRATEVRALVTEGRKLRAIPSE